MRRVLIGILLLCLLAPAAALADRSEQLVIDACRDEKVDGKYTQADYRKALNAIGADTDEYTGCRAAIRRAQLAAASGRRPDGSGAGGGGQVGGGVGGSGPGATQGTGTATGEGADASSDPLASATPKERKALEASAAAGGKPVQIAGELVTPGSLGFGAVNASEHDVPPPLIVLLALLALAALGAGAAWGWSLVLTRRAR